MNEEHPHRPALPLLLLLALASALGVAVAMVLAGLAMLLAAPAYAAEGGLLLQRGSGLAPAQRVYAQAEAHAEGRTRIVEEYHNPYAESLARVYVHRLPAGAVLERVSFSADGGEAGHAVLTLKEGAALVERTRDIGPGEALRVELDYRVPCAARRLLAAKCCSPS